MGEASRRGTKKQRIEIARLNDKNHNHYKRNIKRYEIERAAYMRVAQTLDCIFERGMPYPHFPYFL